MPASVDFPPVTGPQVSPSVPASTTPLANPFSFACLVTVRGGTVSAIAVAGNSLGLTAGVALVPKGASITLTYAVVPAWDWYGLA